MVARTALQGIGNFIFGGAQRRDRRIEQSHTMKQNLLILNSTEFDDTAKETAARKIFQAISPQKYDEIITANPDHTFYSPLMNRAEKKARLQDPYGRRYGKSTRTPGVPTTDDAKDRAAIFKAKESMMDINTGEVDPDIAKFFDAADAGVIARSGYGDNRKDFSEGVDPFGGLDSSLKKPTPEADKMLGPDVMQYDTSEIQKKTKAPGLLRSTFDTIADYFQGPTAAVPQANIPQTMEQVGITDADNQATFQELEKVAPPELDLRGIYVADPQGFKKILDALKAGKTPSGKPFTIKNAIEMLQAFRV